MKSKVAMIVGGNSEIGKELASELSKEYHIIVVSRSLSEKNHCSDYITFLNADMRSPIQIEELKEEIYSSFGQVNLVINVIGKNTRESLDDISEEAWNDVIDSNLKSVFFICKTFGTRMLLEKKGTIINFASTAGIRPLPHSPHYIAAKAGVIALTQYFAQVFAPTIRVNAIAPGYVLTKVHLPENYSKYNDVISKTPLKKMVNKNEIVIAVKYLIGAESTTGQVLTIDGGLIL